MAREPRMHRISAFDSISGRHAAYQRELERLAMEVEDFITVIRGMEGREAAYVADRMEEGLDRVYAAGRLPDAEHKGKAGSDE